MNMLLRPVLALCTLLLLGLAAPAHAQNYPLVCCSYKDAAGNLKYFLAPYTQCPKAQVAKPGYCKNISVCCKTPAGYKKVPFDQCPKAQVPDSYCKTSKRVCCVSNNGFYWDTEESCRNSVGSKIAETRYCERPNDPICCKTRSGGYQKLTPNRCVTYGGTPANDSYCKQSEGKVCCQTPNGFYQWTAAMCKRANGTIVSPKRCRPQTGDKVCCKFTGANGNVVHDMLSPRVCKAYKGTTVPNRYCLRASDSLRLRRR